MVTHDVGLKYYGNRVVKMVDGKVHAIENIDNNLRIEAIRKLKHRINNLETLQIKEGGKNSEMVNDELINNINKPSMTFIRKVSDYEIKRLSNKQKSVFMIITKTSNLNLYRCIFSKVQLTLALWFIILIFICFQVKIRNITDLTKFRQFICYFIK